MGIFGSWHSERPSSATGAFERDDRTALAASTLHSAERHRRAGQAFGDPLFIRLSGSSSTTAVKRGTFRPLSLSPRLLRSQPWISQCIVGQTAIVGLGRTDVRNAMVSLLKHYASLSPAAHLLSGARRSISTAPTTPSILLPARSLSLKPSNPVEGEILTAKASFHLGALSG